MLIDALEPVQKWIKDYYLFNNVESPVYEAFLNDDDGDGIAETFSDPGLRSWNLV